MQKPIKNVTTNVITGFLGVGKTTAILNLIKNKPKNEHWAILVNEAGTIGIDGSVFENTGITTKQIPGGCMCCAGDLPMRVAICKLLRQSRPQRLIIEPSGIGHPHEIIKTLTQPEYQGVLDLKACICLIDPRLLSDPRYQASQMFIDQIAVSDILVANKIDRCSENELKEFNDFFFTQCSTEQIVGTVSHGKLDAKWLDFPHLTDANTPVNISANLATNRNRDLKYYEKIEFKTYCKKFPDDSIFDYNQLMTWIATVKAERLKAILKTNKGILFINCAGDDVSISPIDIFSSNRIEVISSQGLDISNWERNLRVKS